jgi:hypothetical protein
MVTVSRVQSAILRQLRVLIACLVLAVVARPAVTALETPRAVAVLVASSTVRLPDVASPRLLARVDASTHAPHVLLATSPVNPAELAGPSPKAPEPQPRRGARPLYLTQQRFLL